jgi:hypothetical protein
MSTKRTRRTSLAKTMAGPPSLHEWSLLIEAYNYDPSIVEAMYKNCLQASNHGGGLSIVWGIRVRPLLISQAAKSPVKHMTARQLLGYNPAERFTG